jgi:hypothetical protein
MKSEGYFKKNVTIHYGLALASSAKSQEAPEEKCGTNKTGFLPF